MEIVVKIYLAVASFIFLILAYFASRTAYFPLDLAISRSVQLINFNPLTNLFALLSNLGYGPTVDIWMAALVVILFLANKRRESVSIIFLAGLESAFFFGLTKIIHRLRPTSDLIRVVNHLKVASFPSGHVMLYTMVFGFLIYLSLRVKTKWLKWSLMGLFAVIIFLIGLARIYSGEHWPSDVLGAYLLGSIGLILTIYFYRFTIKWFPH